MRGDLPSVQLMSIFLQTTLFQCKYVPIQKLGKSHKLKPYRYVILNVPSSTAHRTMSAPFATVRSAGYADRDQWLYYSLHSLYLFNKSRILNDALYRTAKHMLLSQTNGELAGVLKAYFGDLQLSSDSLDLSRLYEEVLAKVHAFIKHSLEAILESNYSIERAHVHANNFKQSLMSSGGYSGELSFLRETKSLIYGEVEYESFSRVLLLAVQGMGISANTFTDLGSGCGKAVLVAKAIATFKQLVGVEIVNELYDVSTRVVEAFYNNSFSWQANQHCRRDAYNIQLVNCSFLDLGAFDWSASDVVFLNSTCFSMRLMRRVQVLAARALKRGSRVITFTNEFTDRSHFKIIFKERLTMSWGLATVYIHEKISLSRREALGPDADINDHDDVNEDDDDNGNDNDDYSDKGNDNDDADYIDIGNDDDDNNYGHNDDDDDDDEYNVDNEEKEEGEMYESDSKALPSAAQRSSKGSPSERKGSKDSKGSPLRDCKDSKDSSYDFADDFNDIAAGNEDSFFANEDADSRDSRSESSMGLGDEYLEYVLG